MCGICGVLSLAACPPIDKYSILQMLEMLRHRGPDGFGVYCDPQVGLGNARLSIIDLSTGDQPIGNEDESLWIVFNGEIFNYIELRQTLEQYGHHFKTRSDTEVIVHLFEQFGLDCFSQLNGQFAIAIWDNRKRTLILARDRVGVRPLFYTTSKGQLVFGSEIKALLAYPGIQARLNLDALQQVFTFWSVQSPDTIFEGIAELPPGHYLVAKGEQVSVKPFWSLEFTEQMPPCSEQEYLDALENLLIDAVRIRLRADVPIGAYLSGGLDSSVITAMIHSDTRSRLETFSISFSDPDFDESPYQLKVSDFLGTNHHVVYCTHEDIGRIFPEVIWHTETPVLRTAPAPMFLLSRLVHEHDFKVVFTGEGADEFLAGYDIFKEMKLRRFWARNPESAMRPLLQQRLYYDSPDITNTQINYLKAFFRKGLTDTASPYYSHSIRWSNTAHIKRFLRATDRKDNQLTRELPPNFSEWSHLAQAQYLEITTFLTPYLLSSQGDRMAMGNSVEGRYPFLDHRVIEFCNHMPAGMKLHGLTEKWVLRRIGAKLLPGVISNRAKRPYRAPIRQCFFTHPPAYVGELLSGEAIDKSGYFNPKSVTALVNKASNSNLGEVDSMALVGILSTQLIHQQFIKDFQVKPAKNDYVRLVER